MIADLASLSREDWLVLAGLVSAAAAMLGFGTRAILREHRKIDEANR